MQENNNLLKKSFLVLLLFSVIGYAQPTKTEKIHEFVKSVSLDISELPVIPEKWKNESAVVMVDHYNHYYNKTKKSLDNFFLTRRVVQLNDKAAVEKFSEFNYPTVILGNGKVINTWMGIKIIKANGDIKVIDVENEKVKTSTDKKAYIYGFIGVKTASDQIFKLAIPDLEIGDKIDYYIYTHKEYRTLGIDVMTPVETTLRGEYPIVDFKFKLKVENDFFINFKSFNGAPELEDITPEKQRDKEYQLVSKNIDKLQSLRWMHSLVEYPCYKYQISFAQKGGHEKDAYAFLSEKEDIIKDRVTIEDIKTKFKYDFVPEGDYKTIKKKFKDKNLSKKELVEEVYYYLRHYYCNKSLERIIHFNPDLYNKYPVTFYTNYRTGSFKLAYLEFLKKEKIPYEIVFAKHRSDGSVNDLLIRGNLFSFIKINLENEKPLYVFPFTKNTFFNWIPYSLENTKAYVATFSKYDWIEDIKEITLPNSEYKINNTIENTSISLTEDLSSINVNRISSHNGQNKVNNIDERLFIFDYIFDEYKKFGTESYAEGLSKKERAKYETNLSDFIETKKKDHQERLKEELHNEFDFEVEEYKQEIMANGRERLGDTLKYKEEYVIKDYILKRAGPNYIFEIGKFIGDQVAIDEKEKSRSQNIYMPYPRSYENKITFTIPEGYKIAGEEKLNFDIKNETGGFKSTANISGNTLEIETIKYYVNNYESNENWDKMLLFLEAAFQFSQEKILLKKI